MIKFGSDLNPTPVIKTVVLLLVMSFTRTQVGSTFQLIIILLPLIKVYSKLAERGTSTVPDKKSDKLNNGKFDMT